MPFHDLAPNSPTRPFLAPFALKRSLGSATRADGMTDDRRDAPAVPKAQPREAALLAGSKRPSRLGSHLPEHGATPLPPSEIQAPRGALRE